MIARAILRNWHASTIALTLCLAGTGAAQAPARLDAQVQPTVTGKFVGNGKPAGIKFVTVRDREPFSDKPAIELIFSEKDAAASKRPSMDAMFGKLGSALTLSVFHDGRIFGCEVSHSAHQKRGFSSVGSIEIKDFKLEGGNVSGRVTTGKELDTFGEKWEVDLTFAAPLPEKLRNSPQPVAVQPAKPAEAEPKTAAPAGPLIAVQKVPLPKDAANVDFKTAVEQIHLTSPRSVDAVTKELVASLKQGGWKDGAGSLLSKQNSILKREQGAAKLTIMIQSAPKGSALKIFTEGLDWTGAESAPAAAKSPSGVPSVKKIEGEVNKALKNLPKGL